MRAVRSQAVAVLLCASAASVTGARAQGPAAALPPTRSPVVCDMNALTPPPYLSCALWFERQHLLRGTSGEEIAHQRGYSPIALTELVRGDSAKRYAQNYEDYWWTASAFKDVGFGLLAIAFVAGRAPGCEWPPCSATHTHTARILTISGASFVGISVPFAGIAKEAGARALWWHNAWLGR